MKPVDTFSAYTIFIGTLVSIAIAAHQVIDKIYAVCGGG